MLLDRSFGNLLNEVPTVRVGGMPISVLDRSGAAELMVRAAMARRRGGRPLYFTSVNGEAIARASRDPKLAALFLAADQILADGQPLVIASRFLCRMPLPERVATTDLVHDVAHFAERAGATFYLFGSEEEENERAAAALRKAYPDLRIVGRCHGFLKGEALIAKLREINDLAPDIIWLGLGVPTEQQFVLDYSHILPNVVVIKTSGGLFNHNSGKNARAPQWMQRAGFEWLWRMMMEPRRLFWRYLTTNPIAVYALLRYSK
jgi:N-acetylglucosaminyldiphosphoundecaprenol N-acetyl-beta-D-mannosaminyltransferase